MAQERAARSSRQPGIRNLGKWEVNDQVEGAKYLASLPYVDKARIGIWGWSYGGYLTSMVILNGADYFKAAIAVAPVTNWRYYDNIYTERYMGTPAKQSVRLRRKLPDHACFEAERKVSSDPWNERR